MLSVVLPNLAIDFLFFSTDIKIACRYLALRELIHLICFQCRIRLHKFYYALQFCLLIKEVHWSLFNVLCIQCQIRKCKDSAVRKMNLHKLVDPGSEPM